LIKYGDDLLCIEGLAGDTHSHIEEIARRVMLIRQVRKEVGRERLLLLDAGDVFSGTPYFTIYKGSADMRFMNYAGYDAMTLGNHEFDMGPKPLASFIEKARFPVLCANFDFSKEEDIPIHYLATIQQL